MFHLDSHPFYRRIGQGDNRHRRRRSPKAVKLKLMGLDFVLDHRRQRFLPTESDKLDSFCRELGISKKLLPRQNYRSSSGAEPSVRYFVDKFPIFVEGKRVSFCYLDAGSMSCKGFETHLGQYLGLLSALGEVRVYYAALGNRLFPWAKRSFRRTLRLDCPLPPGRLAEFFRLERLYRERRFDRLDQARLIRLRKFRQEFQRPGIEFLYRRWLDLGAKESSLGFDPCSQIRYEFTPYRWNIAMAFRKPRTVSHLEALQIANPPGRFAKGCGRAVLWPSFAFRPDPGSAELPGAGTFSRSTTITEPLAEAGAGAGATSAFLALGRQNPLSLAGGSKGRSRPSPLLPNHQEGNMRQICQKRRFGCFMVGSAARRNE